MAITQELLTKISDYEKQGYTIDEIVQGLQASKNYPDVGTKISAYMKSGYGSDEILQGIKTSPVEKPGFVSRTMGKLGEAYTEATTPIQGEGMWDTLPKIGEKVLRIAGKGGEIVTDAGGTLVKGIYNQAVSEPTKMALSSSMGTLADTDIVKSLGEQAGGIGEAYGQLSPRTRTNIEAGANALMLQPAAQAGRLIAPAVREGAVLAGQGVKRAAGALIPENMAQGILESGAKWSTLLSPKQRNQLFRAMADEKLTLSPAGYDKLNTTVREINKSIKAAIEPHADIPIDAKKVADYASEARGKAAGTLNAEVEIAKVDAEIQSFLNNWDGKLTVGEAQTIKQSISRDLTSHYNAIEKGGAGKFADGEIAAKKNLARGLKEEIERLVDDAPIKEMNARESKLLKLEPHLRRAVGRIENHNILSLDDVLAATAGTVIGAAAGGPVGAAAGAAAAGVAKRALGAPSVKSRIAYALDSLKNPQVAAMPSGSGKLVPAAPLERPIDMSAITGDIGEARLISPGVVPETAGYAYEGRLAPRLIPKEQLEAELGTLTNKIATLEGEVKGVPNLAQIQGELKAKGIPFMKQVNEAQASYEGRIIQQYQRSIGPDVPMAPGKESGDLVSARDAQAKITSKLKGPEYDYIQNHPEYITAKETDPRAISETVASHKAGLHNEIKAEGFDLLDEEAALKEISSFLDEVTGTTPKQPPQSKGPSQPGRLVSPAKGIRPSNQGGLK